SPGARGRRGMSLCWLCPGQGSQTPDMLDRLRADVLTSALLDEYSPALASDTLTLARDAQHCFLNRHAQPLIVLYGVTVAAAARKAGVEPALVAGYSVGELTAHAAAGALSPVTALQLARERARCMDDAAPPDYGMLAVRGVALETLRGHATRVGAEV